VTVATILLQGFEKAIAFGKDGHRGGLSTGDDQPVRPGQVRWVAHLHGLNAGISQSVEMFAHITLQRQDTDPK